MVKGVTQSRIRATGSKLTQPAKRRVATGKAKSIAASATKTKTSAAKLPSTAGVAHAKKTRSVAVRRSKTTTKTVKNAVTKTAQTKVQALKKNTPTVATARPTKTMKKPKATNISSAASKKPRSKTSHSRKPSVAIKKRTSASARKISKSVIESRRRNLANMEFVELWQEADALSSMQKHLKAAIRESRMLERKYLFLKEETAANIETSKQKADQRFGDMKMRLQARETKLILSGRYQIGNALVSAIKEPGLNTLKLPFRLVKLTFEGLITTILR